MAYPWFKFFGGDYLHDEKMLGMDGNVRSCWLTLLCYASTSDAQNGSVRYLTEEQLMIQAGIPIGGDEWDKTKGVLDRFLARGMITIEGDVIRVVNWEKRQSSYASPAERQKKFREKNERPRNARNKKVTLEEEVEEDKDIRKSATPHTPVFERKIREKDEEYRALVKDLAANDYLSTTKIHDLALNEFLPHWLERGEGAKKSRWEKEKSFDYQRRFRTWIANHHKFSKDWKCADGYWHPNKETCHHKAPEPDYKSLPASIFAKSIADSKRINPAQTTADRQAS